MREAPGWTTLARAIVWSELKGRNWRLFAIPLGAGALFLAILGLTAASPGSLTPMTREALRAQADIYFTGVGSDRALLLAMLVVQGPQLVAMLGAVLSVLVTQTGMGQRLGAGELELLLSGPYHDREVFVALVGGSFVLSLLVIAVLAVIAFGGGIAAVAWAGVSLTPAAVRLLVTGLVAPVPIALWATFVAVVVYLAFPETPVNGTEPGNLLIMVGIVPGLAVVILPTAIPSVDPFLVSAGGAALSLLAVAAGWVTVRRWFDVKKVL